MRSFFKWSLIPRETKFFVYFQQEAENVVKMARQLKDMIYVWENVKERARVLADLEQDGDAITHDIMTLLHRSFITPFDREDITALAHSLDDIADRIHSIADTLFLYKIEAPTAKAKEMCEIILQATVEVEGGVGEIKGSIRQPEILRRCVNINQIENSGDLIYRSALAELFAHPTDMASLVKWREIYENMESAIDGCEAIANILEGMAIKYA